MAQHLDPSNPDHAGDWYVNQPPEDERRHSSACVDAMECDGVENCICQPDEQAPAPATYELWWCSYCGEPSCEDSDPCQRCGEAIERIPLVRVSEVAEWLDEQCGSARMHAFQRRFAPGRRKGASS